MRHSLVLVLGCAVMISGCAIVQVPEAAAPVTVSILSDVPFRVALGMNMAQVRALIGPSVVVGYEIAADGQTTQPTLADSLSETEIMTINGQVYQVDTYLVPAEFAAVSGKDHVKLVFKDDVLVARGEAEFKALRQAIAQ